MVGTHSTIPSPLENQRDASRSPFSALSLPCTTLRPTCAAGKGRRGGGGGGGEGRGFHGLSMRRHACACARMQQAWPQMRKKSACMHAPALQSRHGWCQALTPGGLWLR
jgi:hypothetical protein